MLNVTPGVELVMYHMTLVKHVKLVLNCSLIFVFLSLSNNIYNYIDINLGTGTNRSNTTPGCPCNFGFLDINT